MFVRSCTFGWNTYVCEWGYLQELKLGAEVKERIFREYSGESKHLDNTQTERKRERERERELCKQPERVYICFITLVFLANVENC